MTARIKSFRYATSYTSTLVSLIPWPKPTNRKRFVKMHWITDANQRLLLQEKYQASKNFETCLYDNMTEGN